MNTILFSSLILLAQASIDQRIDSFLEFLTKVMLLVGVVMLFYAGWKIHRGEVEDGLLAAVGAFIVALAVPIIRHFFSL